MQIFCCAPACLCLNPSCRQQRWKMQQRGTCGDQKGKHWCPKRKTYPSAKTPLFRRGKIVWPKEKQLCDRIWCPNFCSLNLVHKNGVTDFFSPEFGTRKEFGHPWWSPLKRLISVTVLEPVDAPHFGPLIGSRSPYWIPLKQRISKIEHKAFANPPKPNSRSPDW